MCLELCSDLLPVASIIKLNTTVIYGNRNKLEILSLSTRLGWKGLQRTNNLAYYRNRKLRRIKFYGTGPWTTCWPGGLNKDPTVWLDGARPSPNKPNHVLDKVAI